MESLRIPRLEGSNLTNDWYSAEVRRHLACSDKSGLRVAALVPLWPSSVVAMTLLGNTSELDVGEPAELNADCWVSRQDQHVHRSSSPTNNLDAVARGRTARVVVGARIFLYSTREEVRLVNEREFGKLATESYSFQCRDTFVWNRKMHPHLEKRGEKHADGSLKSLDEHSMDRRVELKCGMPVVLLANLDLNRGLCNGSQGVIVGWKMPNRRVETLFQGSCDHALLKELEIIAYEKNVDEPIWPIVRFSNGIKRDIRAMCQVNELGDDKPYSLLCRTQIPLTPAWAMTVHRAQGMTLDKVKVDVSRAFTDGQVYVALSRATSLRGLQILGDARGLEMGLGGNDEAQQAVTYLRGVIRPHCLLHNGHPYVTYDVVKEFVTVNVDMRVNDIGFQT
ncbi:PIF1 [Diaporthe amygdali]|uniref:PIF1 n=1 Tax=Phomopsis amygdali TaxID=1214568 RepID=UPI0022FE7113|nr:PIF1 [Diaporthe amygdali]KAJ0100703.1 PIF1 [Diaporthe amygdali]